MDLQPVDNDPFAASAPNPATAAITIRPVQDGSAEPTGNGPQLVPVDHDPFAPDYTGIAKQAGIGVAKGAIGIAGLIGDLQDLARKAGSYLPDIKPDPESEKYAQKYSDRGDVMSLGDIHFPDSQDIQGAIEKITGPFRQPQNQDEADAQTVGEFVPAALAGPGGVARKLFTQVAIPGAASIVAGRYSDQNPYVKALAGFLAGGAGTLTSGPSTAEQILRSKLPASVTEQDVTRAGQLIDHAQQRGIGLTWPEALTRVTGQPTLTDTQRILESHGQTRPAMQDFFADRPAQLQNAAEAQFGQISHGTLNPAMIGPQASQAAENTINGVRAAINRATRPAYDAAQQTLVPAQVHAAMRNDPLFVQTLEHVRNTPALNANIGAQSDRSVAVYDAVAKELEQRARNAAQPTNPNASQAVAATTGQLGQQVKDIATRADRNAVGPFNTGAPPGVGNYEFALSEQARLRERYLNPLLYGPLGKIADAPDTKRAISALFQSNPLPGSEQEVGTAVRAIAARRPAVAEQLVRAHAEMTFNEAARELQGGANQFAGAKFVKMLAGNSQQRRNLQAAVEALPNGAERWRGFEHLLDIMAATGARQPKGSLTAFNELEVQSMSNSGLASLAAKGASPGKWMSFANDTFKSWSLGRNLDQLARILTDPRAGNALRQIVRIPSRSDRALVMVGRLIGQFSAATTEQRNQSAKKNGG